jgi:hypothetical protein
MTSLLTQQTIPAPPSTVTVYPAPEDAYTFGSYQVTVQGNGVPVYRAIQNDYRSRDDDWDLDYGDYGFVSFDAAEPVEVRITSNLALDQGVLRPLSDGIRVEFPQPNVAVFRLEGPGQFSFEPFGPYSPLMIFYNPPETELPDPEDPTVIYFGPGRHRPESGLIHLGDGQTLYLAGGAIVEAGLRIQGENVTVRGRGILDGTPWHWRKGPTTSPQRWACDETGRQLDPGHMNRVQHSRQVRVEGISIRGAWQWTFFLENSEDLLFENIKIVGGKNHNDDGIDPVNSRNVTIRNSFIRTSDDCFALKGHYQEDGPVEQLWVENCVLWSETQRIVLLGHESRAPAMRDIVFRDIDVIHMGPNIGFALHPGEEMVLENVWFEDIRIHTDGYVGILNPVRIFEVRPEVNRFMHNKVPGLVRDITFKNITVSGPETRKRLLIVAGWDEKHTTRNIRFENVRIHGELASEESEFVIIGDHTQGITFSPNSTRTP